jgi:hypothetical protein
LKTEIYHLDERYNQFFTQNDIFTQCRDYIPNDDDSDYGMYSGMPKRGKYCETSMSKNSFDQLARELSEKNG